MEFGGIVGFVEEEEEEEGYEEKGLPVCFWRRLRAMAEESDEELGIWRRPEMGL